MAYTPIGTIDAKILTANPAAYGVDFIADTDPHTGSWYRIDVIATAVFNAFTDGSTQSGTRTLDGTAGKTHYGKFTSIDMTSGTVLAYRSTP